MARNSAAPAVLKPVVRLIFALVLCAAANAVAHDVGVDATLNVVRPTEANPRTGGLGLTLSGSVDLSDRWTVVGSAGLLRDQGTVAAGASSSGSTILLGTLGVLFVPTDNLMFLVGLAGSPRAVQRNAVVMPFASPTGVLQRVEVVTRSETTSASGALTALWLSGVSARLEHSVDVTAGGTRYDVFQQLEVPNTTAGALLRNACANTPDATACRLARGVATPLWQVRLAAGYTATLFRHTDLGLLGTLFLYDQDPTQVGYFSLVSLGRVAEVGGGVPVLPLRWAARPSVAHRFSKVTLKVSYQVGGYVDGLGNNHQLTLRATLKATDALRFTAQLGLQGDTAPEEQGLSNQALTGMAGVLWDF